MWLVGEPTAEERSISGAFAYAVACDSCFAWFAAHEKSEPLIPLPAFAVAALYTFSRTRGTTRSIVGLKVEMSVSRLRISGTNATRP